MTLAPEIQIVVGLVVASAMMAVLWLVQRRTGNAGIVDAGWAGGIGLLGIFFAVTSDGYLPRRVLVAVLIGFWAARLASTCWWTASWAARKRAATGPCGKSGARRPGAGCFVSFRFRAGGVVLCPARPGHRPSSGGSLDAVGLGRRDHLGLERRQYDPRRPATRPLQAAAGKPRQDVPRGLVAYSRHPNYFFEWLHWWAYVALAVGASYGWLTLLAPAVMLYFLVCVTGIPPTEAQALASRGEDYRQYQRTTSVFIPWFPKREGKP